MALQMKKFVVSTYLLIYNWNYCPHEMGFLVIDS